MGRKRKRQKQIQYPIVKEQGLVSFDENGGFSVNLFYDTHTLEQLFRHKVMKLLLDEGTIGEWHVNLLLSWRHSGFNVHVGDPIPVDDRQALEKLAHYIIRCPFSQERMSYHAATRTVTYRSKDGKSVKEFDALDWLASIICHIPNRWEQMVMGAYGVKSSLLTTEQKWSENGVRP